MSSEKKEKDAPEIINLVNINDLKGVESLLMKGGAKVDAIDENGMTALQHAAYKGQVDMCRLLLSYGADINADHHDHNYSALHFGSLSGSIETVQLLLASGSKAYHQNSLGRTAAQMAGFVGNHAVVALINNYFPLDNIQYYSIAHDLEAEPKIPKAAVKPLYDLIMNSNLHPVYIAITVSNNEELVNNCGKSYKLLQLLCEKEAKRSENVNEVLCLKFHYLSYVLNSLDKELRKSAPSEKAEIIFEGLIKKWLRARLSDGFEEYMEFYLRDAIKAFQYPEMPLFQQLVRSITSDASDFSSLGLLHGLINGQRGFQDDSSSCGACGLENKEAKTCSKCKRIHYCNKLCQKLHWSSHKKFCSKVLSESSGSSRTTNGN